MCLITLSLRQHKYYPFILVANRDEFYARATAKMDFWKDDPNILAGQDLQKLGSWLGLHKNGRFSAVTNFRQAKQDTSEEKLSRGNLIVDSLTSPMSSNAFSQALLSKGHSYGPYNLLTADTTGLYFNNNHDNSAAIKLTPGLYGLCNASLDTPWPKLVAAKEQLQHKIMHLIDQENISLDDLQDLLTSNEKTHVKLLPNTGIAPKWEHALSSQFIALDDYGTRAKTIILQRWDGSTQICETSYFQGQVTDEVRFSIQLPLIGGR